MQRKLLKIALNRGLKQLIIATHSAEIISDVPPNYVVVVNKREAESRPLLSQPGLQEALSGIGSVHNIQLSKLGSAGKVLFVEGDDASYLSDIAAKIGARELERFSQLPIISLGGKSNLIRAMGTADALHKVSAGQIKTIALIDGDFLSEIERNDLIKSAEGLNLSLHILSKYEIENYFICYKSIREYIVQNESVSVTDQEILLMIEESARELKLRQISKIADHLQRKHKSKQPSTLMQLADSWVEERLSNGDEFRDIFSGKEIFSIMSSKCKSKFGVSFGSQSICKKIELSSIPLELRDFVRSLVS